MKDDPILSLAFSRTRVLFSATDLITSVREEYTETPSPSKSTNKL